MRQIKLFRWLFFLCFFSFFTSNLFAAGDEPVKPSFSFGVFADVQYVDWEPVKTRHYRNALPRLKEIALAFNTRRPEFVIHLGDLIDQDYESFEDVLPLINEFKDPFYHVVGNHDYAVGKDEKEKILSTLSLKKSFYDFEVKSWKFIVLDGNEISFFTRPYGAPGHKEARKMYDELKARKAVNAQVYNGAMSAEQMNWLKEELSLACEKKQKVILFSHYPVYPENIHNLWNDGELLEAIKPFSCVKAYFGGHNHYGNYGKKDGVHFVTLEAVVETPDTNAYAIVDVFDDHLQVHGFGRVPSRKLDV